MHHAALRVPGRAPFARSQHLARDSHGVRGLCGVCVGVWGAFSLSLKLFVEKVERKKNGTNGKKKASKFEGIARMRRTSLFLWIHLCS
jgi:hypothetical protein